VWGASIATMSRRRPDNRLQRATLRAVAPDKGLHLTDQRRGSQGLRRAESEWRAMLGHIRAVVVAGSSIFVGRR